MTDPTDSKLKPLTAFRGIHMAEAQGETIKEMRERLRENNPAFVRLGDATLMWVNAGDLSAALIEGMISEAALRARVAELEGEVERLRGGWQPIETAPENQPVLVQLRPDSGGTDRIACLRLQDHAGETWWETTDDASQIAHCWRPVCWMPQPTLSPTEGGE